MSGGTAPGLLLLHGFTGGPESWDRVRQALPRDLRVAAPALLGHGPGGGDVSAEDFDAEVDRLAQFG
ncbi:MAG: alpha/beta fold hydrolase, partial [Myxococcota bacterium]